MSTPWTDHIDQLRDRLGGLIERAHVTDDTGELMSEALEELAVVVEEMQAQNGELIASRADLELERERYRNLFDTVPDGYVVTDTRGIMHEVNTTASDLFGRPRSRLIGRPLGSLIVPEDRRAFYGFLHRIGRSGPGTQLTIDMKVRDGVIVPANLRATVAATTTPGEPDIRWLLHDRRPDLFGQELRISEERLRALFDSADVGVVLTDSDGSVLFANRRADQILDAESSLLLLADDWLGRTDAADDHDVRETLRSVIETGRTASIRHRLRRSDGTVRWIDHGFSPLRSADDSVDGVVSTLSDVTAEQVATIELRDSIEFTEAILDTVGALVVVLTPAGVIQRFNKACEQATGFGASSMIGRHIVDAVVPPDQHDEVRAVFERAVTGDPITFENDWLTADGRRRRIAWTSTTLVQPDGSARAVISAGIDVTETRLMEARLTQADRLESIGRLAAGVAHDFNNTLSTLMLRIDRLNRRRQGEPDQDLAQRDAQDEVDLEAAAATIERTRHLIADVVSFSRQQHLDPHPISINTETERIISLLAELLGDQIGVVLDLTPDNTSTTIDPGRFEQALTNLVLNARDAMTDGGTLTIATRCEHFGVTGPAPHLPAGPYIRLAITDTGNGIDPDIAPRVFDPYFTTKPPARGTGLGLATTYGTITQTGGAIVVDSTPNEGTTFTVWLPQTTALPTQAPLPTARPGSRARTYRVLVVEDDNEICDLLEQELRRLGYEILTADTAEAALDRHGRGEMPELDLLVSDVQLPGIDGPALARRLETAQPGLVTLFISGATPSTLADVLPAGASPLLKPFDVDQLARAVAAALDTSDTDADVPADPSRDSLR